MINVILLILALTPFSQSARLRATSGELGSYSFAQFVTDYKREYQIGHSQYAQRAEVFQASLMELVARHARNIREERSYSVGIHPFMDWTREERAKLGGYKPSRTHSRHLALLEVQTSESTISRLNATNQDGDGFSGASVALRNQGNCGSCWAISAVEAVEAQLHRNGGDTSVRLSAQALVDCVPNPQHCGGTGGCDGATGELAYTYMRDHGIPLESDLPYNAQSGTCPYVPSSTRAVVSGWHNLPSNQAKPLQNALLQEGPAVVAVDASDWFDYNDGIFDGCKKDAIIDHAVLLKAYGNSDDGKQYWLIQNSWGSGWGENGYIRLLLREDEDEYCGVDKKPQEGLGCDGGPSEVRVCGQCGLLLDPVIPQGARIINGDTGIFGDGAASASQGNTDMSATLAAAPSWEASTTDSTKPDSSQFDLVRDSSATTDTSPQTSSPEENAMSGSSFEAPNTQDASASIPTSDLDATQFNPLSAFDASPATDTQKDSPQKASPDAQIASTSKSPEDEMRALLDSS